MGKYVSWRYKMKPEHIVTISGETFLEVREYANMLAAVIAEHPTALVRVTRPQEYFSGVVMCEVLVSGIGQRQWSRFQEHFGIVEIRFSGLEF